MADTYRQAASILVLRPVDVCKPGGACETVYQILLLRKPRKNDAWQLPQGGVEEGETVTQAALRELKEEASLGGCTVLGISDRMYKYDFPESYRRFRPDNVCGQHISFVFAVAPKDASVTVDAKEIDGYAWVGVDQLGQYIHREQYRELVKELYQKAVKILSPKH